VRAEIAYLVQRFDPAKLYHIEQAIEHSKTLLKDWLPKYKFKDWTHTRTRNNPVTDAMKEHRAEEIAEILGDAGFWHSHGRGITLDELQSDNIKLDINNFGMDEELSKSIRNYYSLVSDYLAKVGMGGVVHSKNGLMRAR